MKIRFRFVIQKLNILKLLVQRGYYSAPVEQAVNEVHLKGAKDDYILGRN